MRKLSLISLLTFLLQVTAPATDAQQQGKVFKIGWLGSRTGSTQNRDALTNELRALGYVEGRNVSYEVRSAQAKPDRLPALAAELVRLKVDVILMGSTVDALAAKSAIAMTPLVIYGGGDPVADGLVDSLARPGGNITGVTNIASTLSGKRLELLKETVSKLSRVALLWHPRAPSSAQQWKESQLPARELKLQLHSVEINAANDLESAFAEAIKAQSGALAVTASPMINSNQKQIADLAAKHRLPAIYTRADFVESGGLMSYGADQAELLKNSARIIDKILKGTKPADIPVEQPTKFELLINLKTAKALNLTIPPIVLMRATKVVK